MATRTTTCEACFDLPSNDQAKPVEDGSPVRLCKLTRPEVKERIQKKVDKKMEIDEDVCPKCHHDVGDHVFTNDDGMYSHYPPFSPVSLFRCVCSFPSFHPAGLCSLTQPPWAFVPLLPAAPTAMTWPPQPIGVQSQAQGRFVVL